VKQRMASSESKNEGSSESASVDER